MSKQQNEVSKVLALYNMIPNITWSVLNLAPVSVFCFHFVALKTLYIFLAVSLLPAFFKNAFLDKIQISNTIMLYKKAGIHIVNRFAQNGEIINKMMKKKYPAYRAVTNKRSSIATLIGQTYLFEKFHLMLFVFFSLIIVYCLSRGQQLWAFVILITNIAYNIYPNLLQQYIRLKLKLYNGRMTGS